jgi:hypothetical protein
MRDEASGIWFFNLTDDSAGEDVTKSLKNEASKRRVPIHSKLISLGILEYLNAVKSRGHDRIFNQWKPKDGRASYRAEEYFRKYLRDIGLRDATLKKKVSGMHSLRSTFITHSARSMRLAGNTTNQALAKIQPIVGHTDSLTDENGKDLRMTAGYVDEGIMNEAFDNLAELREVVEALDYGIVFHSPALSY